MIYTATHYKGKPAILDTKTRVYYTGFASMMAARVRAAELNAEDAKNPQPKPQTWRKF